MITQFIAVLAFQAHPQTMDCSRQAEKFVTAGNSQPGQLTGTTTQGHLIFIVRVNDQGGDAAYEVIVEANSCAFVSKRLLWSE